MKTKALNLLLAGMMFSLVFLSTGVTVFAKAKNEATLDLEAETVNLPDRYSIDQNYTLKKEGDTVYNNVTKVKLEWEIRDISLSYTLERTWDPDTMSWVEDKTDYRRNETTADAKFTLTNYSSVPVRAGVVFEVEDTCLSSFDKLVTVNNDCTVGSVVAEDKTVDLSRDHDEVIRATVSVNTDALYGYDDTDGTEKYGTYTVILESTGNGDETAFATVNTGDVTVLSAGKTPAEGAEHRTEVDIPAGTNGFTPGKIAELTVETKTATEASRDSAFDIASGVSAVGAITLSVKSNGVPVTSFKNENSEDVAVTVTTYIIKGLTNVTLRYIGEGDDPTDVTYDAATGKLTFKTTHFSTFSVGADQSCMLTGNNTAYDTLEDAIAAIDGSDTLIMLKNETFSGTVSLSGENGATVTLDLGGKTLTWSDMTVPEEYDCIALGGNAKFVIQNGTLVNTAGTYGALIESGEFDPETQLVLSGLTVSHVDHTTMNWGAVCADAGKTTILDCDFTTNTVGIQIASGEAYIANTSVSAASSAFFLSSGAVVTLENCEAAGAKRAIHVCTSGATVTVNGGVYAAEFVIQLDNANPSAVDWQGNPNYAGGSFCIVNAGTFDGGIKQNLKGENAIAQLYVNGGTFSSDVSGYPTYDGE